MSDRQNGKTYPLEQALKAQAALRAATRAGHTDEHIARLIQESSGIQVTDREIRERYATRRTGTLRILEKARVLHTDPAVCNRVNARGRS